MKLKLFLTLLIVSVFSSLSFSQTDRDLVSLANDMFKNGDYDDALNLYKQAIELNPDNSEANFKLGRCYVNTSCCKKESTNSYKKAYSLDPTIDQRIYFFIGDGFQRSYQFDSAKVYFNKYKTELEINRRDFLGIDVDAEIKIAERRLYECDNGKEFKKNPYVINIVNLGENINSPSEDYSPTISINDDEIYFTSRRTGSVGDAKDKDNKFFEDVWYSKKDGESWATPVNLGAPINTNGHNSNIALSPDGKRLFIYTADNAGDILYSDKKDDGTWSSPVPVGGLNTEMVETSISITSDSKMMFYTSSKIGGFGGKDIYYCELDESLKCITTPKNIGEQINSVVDEESPYYDVSNNILYFASKGHKGMGGYDLFESTYDEKTDRWTTPINLGMPVNSPEDDVFMSLTADGKTGYYATVKEDSYGGNDLYKIFPINRILDETVADTTSEEPIAEDSVVEDSEDVANLTNGTDGKNVTDGTDGVAGAADKDHFTKKTTLLKLKILNEFGQKVAAHVEIHPKGSLDVLTTGKAVNGSYSFAHAYSKDNNLMVSVDLQGYFFQNVDVMFDEKTGAEKELVITLKTLLKKTVRPLRFVYFSFDKTTLTNQSQNEINNLHQMLVENPTMRIEVAGHTDFIGSHSYNNHLSHKRALAVKNALVKKGIAAKRINAVGYGEKHPLATNDDEEDGRELNRRTEFIIIEY